MAKKGKQLIFIDTSIWLNFYRRSQGVRIELLQAITKLSDRVITGFQLQTEFFRNRQAILKDSLEAIARLKDFSIPPIVASGETATALTKASEDLNEAVRKLKSDARLMFENPSVNDPVYQAVVHLSSRLNSTVNLTSDSATGKEVVAAAKSRFIEGKPPRKSGDTSCGDAIHWEWVLRCAKDHDADVLVVTNDSDFGVTFENRRYLGDYLREEFAQRVGKNRVISIDDKLANALQEFKINVSSEALEEEKKQSTVRLAVPVDSVWARALQQVSTADQFAQLSALPKIATASEQFLDEMKRQEKERIDALSILRMQDEVLKASDVSRYFK